MSQAAGPSVPSQHEPGDRLIVPYSPENPTKKPLALFSGPVIYYKGRCSKATAAMRTAVQAETAPKSRPEIRPPDARRGSTDRRAKNRMRWRTLPLDLLRKTWYLKIPAAMPCSLKTEQRVSLRPPSIRRETDGNANFFHGEFDPGSGRTLAACLIHASRAGSFRGSLRAEAKDPSGGRVSNTWATCPQDRDNSRKRGLIPDKRFFRMGEAGKTGQPVTCGWARGALASW